MWGMASISATNRWNPKWIRKKCQEPGRETGSGNARGDAHARHVVVTLGTKPSETTHRDAAQTKSVQQAMLFILLFGWRFKLELM